MDAILEFTAGIFFFGAFGVFILLSPILFICDIISETKINPRLAEEINHVLIFIYVIALLIFSPVIISFIF